MNKLPHVSINGKLHKRTLRAKINKILTTTYKHCCNKLISVENRIVNINSRKTEIEEEQDHYHNSLPTHPPMKFAEEYRYEGEQVKAHHPTPLQMQMLLKQHLTYNELLEIGEDPAYFLQNEEMRLLDWVGDEWTSQTPKNSFRPKKVIEKQKIIYPDVPVEVIDREKIVEKNKLRQERFLQNYQKEVSYQQDVREKMLLKFNDKISMTNKRLDARTQGVIKTKEIRQQEELQRYNSLKDHMKKKLEEEEIYNLSAKLKELALKRSIEMNVEKWVKQRSQSSRIKKQL